MSGGRVLVVEDDIDIYSMLQLYFKSQGYEVYVAPRGGVALEMTRQNMPNVIVLDINLPTLTGTKYVASCGPICVSATFPLSS